MKKKGVLVLLSVLVILALSLSACAPSNDGAQVYDGAVDVDETDSDSSPRIDALNPLQETEPSPVSEDESEQQALPEQLDVKEEQEEPVPTPLVQDDTSAESRQTMCVDSARGDVRINGVVQRGAAMFTDYCCGDHFKVDYYCENGSPESNTNVHCPSGCVDDRCLPEVCGNDFCYGDEFTTCPQDCASSADFSITGIEYSDLAGELAKPYVSFMLVNEGDEEVNLRDYYFVYYNLDAPKSTTSPLHAFAYSIIGSQVVPAGEEMLVTIKQQGLAMDDEFCDNMFRVGLAKQKMFARCTTAVNVATEIVTINELPLVC